MQSKEPNVVIITRTKSRPLLLKRALKSVQSQDYLDYLHVIVNDGGDPVEVESLCNRFETHRIRILHNSSSLGMEAASNIGLRAYTGKYAVIHDDDDSWHPEFLGTMVASLESLPHVSGVVCNINQIFEVIEAGKPHMVRSRLFNPAVKRFSYKDFLVVNQFVPIAFLYRYDVHSKIGFYDESLEVCGDWDFHLRFLNNYAIEKIAAPLANYHIRLNQTGGAINSIAKVDAHRKARALIMARYDSISKVQKLVSLLRVKVIYRVMNLLLRRICLPRFKDER